MNDLNTIKEYLEEEIKKCEQEIAELTNKIENIERDVDNINTHKDVINKINTLVKRDFRGFLLTNVIDFINMKSKEYCKYIFVKFNIYSSASCKCMIYTNQ